MNIPKVPGALLAIIFLLFTTEALANHGLVPGLLVIENVPRYSLAGHLEFIEDTEGKLAIADVIAGKGHARPWQHRQTIPNFGYSSSAYWLRARLKNLSVIDAPMLIEVAYPLLDHLEVYFANGDHIIKQYKTGDQLPFSQRPLPTRNFVFPIPKTESKTLDVYFYMDSRGNLELPANLWQKQAYEEKQSQVILTLGAFYGVIAVMSLYNLLLFFAVRDRSYLYYVGCTGSFLLLLMTTDGIAYQFITPDMPRWMDIQLCYSGIFALLFLCLFSFNFLKLGSARPRLPALAVRSAMVVLGLLAVVAWAIPYEHMIRLLVYSALGISLLCFVLGAYMLAINMHIARYYLLAWSSLFIGSVVLGLSKTSILPISFFTNYALHMGIAIEVVLFSLALADRITMDKKEKILAKQNAIDSLQKYKSLYENALEGIFQCTTSGTFLSVNPTMVRIMGHQSPDELITNINEGKHHLFDSQLEAADFIQVLQERGQVLDYEIKGHRPDGKPYWCSLSAKLIDSQNVIEGFVVDITQRKTSEEQLAFLSQHDPLTGLLNRREFEIHLQRALRLAHSKDISCYLLYMDIDQFKLINNTCGHIAGDEMLRQITAQIQGAVRSIDILARLGGDEFGLLLEDVDAEEARFVADNLRQLIQDFRFDWDTQSFTLGVSIGMVMLNSHTESVKNLLSLADAACFSAKDSGRNRVQEYSPGDLQLVSKQHEMQWASQIVKALEEDRLLLYQQQIVVADTAANRSEPDLNEALHFEVLVRMLDDDKVVFPGSFIPAAERYNLMPAIDRWVVSHLFMWLSENADVLNRLSSCAINLSGLTLSDQNFSQFLRDLFAQYPIPANKICFEITETAAVTNLATTLAFMHEFEKLGCKFALDDFGSGFSSYGYLKKLPVDFLKIDGSFVRDMCQDPIDQAMVESINRIGHVMNKQTIAEFVENEEILQRLQAIGVDFAQGYGIAKPEPLSELQLVAAPLAINRDQG